MSLFSSALDVVSNVAKLVPGYGTLVSSAIDLFKNVVDKVAPMVNSAVNQSTLPDNAKSTFNDAYNFAFGG